MADCGFHDKPVFRPGSEAHKSYTDGMTDPTGNPQRRWYHLTPDRLVLSLLAVEGLLFVLQWFCWLPKGWPVLIAIAAVAVVMLLMFLWFAVALVFPWQFQFSIRSLLVLTVAVALPCSWMALLAVEAFLPLSERFHWFPFNEHKGSAA